MKNKNEKPWTKIIIFLLILWIVSSITASFFNLTSKDISRSNIAIIKIYGTIRSTSSDGFLGTGVSANDVVELLDESDKNPLVRAIVLDINSGGGSAVGSDEIGRKVKSLNKTTVAWVREIGASGAYWIASNTDYIIANRMSLVGSIGVTGSYLEIAKLLEDYNVTYRRLVSGKYKDAGTPFKELTRDEEKLIQDLVDELHGQFVSEVALNRNLSESFVRPLATGEVFSGAKAYDLGLVDEIGGINEVTLYLEKTLNTTIEYKIIEKEETFSDLLRKIISEQSFYMGQGIGSFLNINPPIIKT